MLEYIVGAVVAGVYISTNSLQYIILKGFYKTGWLDPFKKDDFSECKYPKLSKTLYTVFGVGDQLAKYQARKKAQPI